MIVTLTIAADETAFAKKAAQTVLEAVTAAVRAGGACSVALSGGSTPKKFLALLAQPYYRERVPWPQVFFFWADERCVPPDHPESNYRMAEEALFSKVPVPKSNLFRIPAEMDPPSSAARAYEQTLRLHFKSSNLPKFDLILLGLGEDGHTASLFPDTPAVAEKVRWVAANYVEKLSAYRITLTFPVINNAARVVFAVGGSAKAAMMKEVLAEKTGRRLPAQMVAPVSGELVWLVDKAAASAWPETVRRKAV